MTRTPNKRPRLFTIANELQRYGVRRGDVLFCAFWLLLGIKLALVVPVGQGLNIVNFLNVHIALFGFGATVFGFTILGGKDEFFEPIIESSSSGVFVLRDMVLYLFSPLMLHATSATLLVFRLLLPQFTDAALTHFIWRGTYGFVAVWAFAQTMLSFRFLFVLAITRLMWKDRQVKERQKREVYCVTCRQAHRLPCPSCQPHDGPEVSGADSTSGRR